MDAGIVDTLNRRDVALLVARLDVIDDDLRRGLLLPGDLKPWYHASIADTFLSTSETARSDQAWLFGSLVASIPGIRFDGCPADCDWDNLFGHLRTEILSRRDRDPQNPPAGMAEILPRCVV